MEQTPVLGLKKPGLSDPVDIRDLNENADALEAAFSNLAVSSLAVPRVIEMDFSNFKNGTFTEKLEGEQTLRAYHVSFDTQQRPVSIRDDSGFRTTIKW